MAIYTTQKGVTPATSLLICHLSGNTTGNKVATLVTLLSIRSLSCQPCPVWGPRPPRAPFSAPARKTRAGCTPPKVRVKIARKLRPFRVPHSELRTSRSAPYQARNLRRDEAEMNPSSRGATSPSVVELNGSSCKSCSSCPPLRPADFDRINKMNRMPKRKTEPTVDRSRISRAGGPGFQPVISGVAPEIVRLSSRLEL